MRKLRRYSPGTKLIIMTGSEITETMMKSVQDNAHLLIAKPFDLDRIKMFVDRILTTGKPLYRDESAAMQDYDSFIKWIADGNRKHERKPISKRITCFPVTPAGEMTADGLSAHVIDISEAGMCIRTACLLKPGTFRLSDTRRSARGSSGGARTSTQQIGYWAGIQFVTDENA
jgi:hypothetical protein